MLGGKLHVLLACSVVALLSATPVVTSAQVLAAEHSGEVVSRCIGLELYVRGDKERDKAVLEAGTFVVISGVVYFAFMAAWLNVFLLIGMLTPVRIALATLAILVGSIHIKDFFAFNRGVSLSIPEAAKPGIYNRVRRIVTAENLTGAILGAAVLATLVNVVELLCTAGLPALYTQILSAQQLPSWQNYMYLALYNVAYMVDDAVMVTIAVITLGRRKLQETHGRWLKLVSGVAILVLGAIMLFRPTWLGMS